MQIATTSQDLEAMNLELSRLALYPIYGVFTTIGATCLVKAPTNFRRFRVVGYIWAGQPATDEHLYVDTSAHTVATDGTFPAVTDSAGGYTIQFARVAASKTSGLAFMALIVGLP